MAACSGQGPVRGPAAERSPIGSGPAVLASPRPRRRALRLTPGVESGTTRTHLVLPLDAALVVVMHERRTALVVVTYGPCWRPPDDHDRPLTEAFIMPYAVQFDNVNVDWVRCETIASRLARVLPCNRFLSLSLPCSVVFVLRTHEQTFHVC